MPESRRIRYVDVDGVLVPTNSILVRRLNKVAGTKYRLADIISFDYREFLPPEHVQIIMEMWADPTLYDRIRPDPKAVKAVRKMRETDRVVALSAPTIGNVEGKFKLLLRPPLSFLKNDIVIAWDKSLLGKPDEGDNVPVLIDDGIDNLLRFNGKKICFAKPWNALWDENLGLRTDDWDEIVEEVK